MSPGCKLRHAPAQLDIYENLTREYLKRLVRSNLFLSKLCHGALYMTDTDDSQLLAPSDLSQSIFIGWLFSCASSAKNLGRYNAKKQAGNAYSGVLLADI